MEIEPERIEIVYLVRYVLPGTKRKITTRWHMTEEEAAAQFSDREYEVLRNTKIERKVGGDPLKLSMAGLYRNHNNE